MSIIQELASQTGERGGEANRRAAFKCLENPALFADIVSSLTSKDANLAADCCEVLTEAAKLEPVAVAPYGQHLPVMFAHKSGRAQWEAMHCFALIAPLIPEIVKPLLPRLMEIIRTNKGVIVRDYAIDAVGNYAKSGKDAASAAFPLLKESLQVWEGRHAVHGLEGLLHVLPHLPSANEEIYQIAFSFQDNKSASIKKAAKKLAKACA